MLDGEKPPDDGKAPKAPVVSDRGLRRQLSEDALALVVGRCRRYVVEAFGFVMDFGGGGA
jgi:hypothetical protein